MSDSPNFEQFDWWKPGAVAQWLMQKFMGLKSEQGAWPLIFSAVAPAEELKGAETGKWKGLIQVVTDLELPILQV